MRKKFISTLSFRTAITLLVMLLTSATAWALKTETPVSYTVTRAAYGSTITISGGGTTTSWNGGTGFGNWKAGDSHNLANGMTVKTSANVTVNPTVSSIVTSTTFTFTTDGTTAITGVKFKYGNADVAASSTSSEPGTTFTVTIAKETSFTSFEVTYGNLSGSCGSKATWSLAKQNGKYTALTISGSGAINDYDHTTVDKLWRTTAPWDYDLTSVTIGSNITSIGNYAFIGCQQLASLTIGSHVTTIGTNAFDHCDALTEVTLPGRVHTLGSGVFTNCVGLTRLNIQKSDALVTIGSSSLNGCNALQYIVVPTPALAVQYKTAANWSAHASKMSAEFGGYIFHIDGTTADDAAYAIATADDLNHLAAAVNASTNINNISKGKIFRQTDNISYSNDICFTAIGSSVDTPFRGTYDGQNYLIYDIFINKYGSTDDDCNQGIFGYIQSDATVMNIILGYASITGYNNVGGIAGYSNGTIMNCHVIGAVTIYAVVNSENHGGIVGANYGTVIGCTSSAKVFCASKLSDCYNFGGIAGKNRDLVQDCIYLGSRVEGNAYVGAIAGINYFTVANCYYADPNFCGKNSSGSYISHANSTVGGSDGNCNCTNSGPALQDNADNSSFLAQMSARNASLGMLITNGIDVTLQGRTLYKDGKWNTICLPFDVTLSGSPLEGATARTLTGASINGSTLNLTFGGVVTDKLVAGTPYIIKWANGDDIVEPVFTGVTVTTEKHDFDNGESGDQRVRFIGTYNAKMFEDRDNSVLIMGGGNTLYYPNAGAGIGAQRAYFKIGDDNAAHARQLTAFSISFGDEVTTGIISIENGQLTIDNSWYTVDGRRLTQKPAQRGMYINGGKKVIVR